MFVGFYDKSSNQLLEVEKVDFSLSDARMTSVHLAALWQSGEHSLPAPIWVVWDNNQMGNGKAICSIFSLNDKLPPSALCDRIKAITQHWNT